MDSQFQRLMSPRPWRFLARGFQFAQEPGDEPWLWREAHPVDPSGNVICLYHAGEKRLNLPSRIEAEPGAQPDAPTAAWLVRSRDSGY
jgi:hypothetical protein